MTEETKTLTEELNECYYSFIEAFSITTNSYSEAELIKIKEFVITLAREYTPYGIMTVQSINEVVGNIFTVELNRDFIWKLTFNYFSILGYDSNQYSNICKTLAFAANVGDNYNENPNSKSITPSILKEKLQTYEDLGSFLLDNKWMVIVLMIIFNYQRQYPNLKTIQSVLEG